MASPLVSALALLLIPALLYVFAVSVSPYVDITQYWLAPYACQFEVMQIFAEAECARGSPIAALKFLSLATTAFVLAYVGFILVICGLCGSRARMLSALFPFCMRVTLLLAPIYTGLIYCCIVFPIAVFARWLASTIGARERSFPVITEISEWLGVGSTMETLILIPSGLLGLALVFITAVAAFSEPQIDEPLEIYGVPLEWDDAPELWERITELSGQQGVRRPRWLFIGWDFNAWIADRTTYNHLDDTAYEGLAVFLSLPLFRILTRPELDSILAHEMAHFSGGDIAAGNHFERTFQQAEAAQISLQDMSDEAQEEEDGITVLMNISIRGQRWMLWHLTNSFAFNLAAMTRKREKVADRVALNTTSASAFAGTELKIALLGELWAVVTDEYASQASNGSTRKRDITTVFLDAIKVFVRGKALDHAFRLLQRHRKPHPFDTHPPSAERMRNAGINPRKLDFAALIEIDPTTTAHTMLKDLDHLLDRLDPQRHRGGTIASDDASRTSLLLASAVHDLVAMGRDPGQRADFVAGDLAATQTDYDFLDLIEVLSGRVPQVELDQAIDGLRLRLDTPSLRKLGKTVENLAKQGKAVNESAQNALLSRIRSRLSAA